MNENIVIDFYNEGGVLRNLDDIKKDLDGVYEIINNKEKDNLKNPLNVLFDSVDKNEADTDLLLNQYELLERKIYLETEINDEISSEILKKIQFFNSYDTINCIPIEERLPIQIYINTVGGEFVNSMQIMNAIKLSETPVYTITTGSAYSGGLLIAIAGHKRFGFPNSSYLFHEGSTMFIGDAHKTIQGSKFYENQLKQMKQFIIKNTNIDEEMYNLHKKDDWYFTAVQAKELGVIDFISTDINGGIYDEQ